MQIVQRRFALLRRPSFQLFPIERARFHVAARGPMGRFGFGLLDHGADGAMQRAMADMLRPAAVQHKAIAVVRHPVQIGSIFVQIQNHNQTRRQPGYKGVL